MLGGTAAAAGEHGGKLDDIEVLRGVSVLLVLVYHIRTILLFWWQIPLWQKISENYFDLWCGVDIFFAISGFVIARSLLPKLRAAATDTDFFFEVFVFWIRRAWRLMPAAWFWLAAIALIAQVLPHSEIFASTHVNFESTIAGLLGVANYRGDRYFMQKAYGASYHYWTLSLEEQFYLALPAVIFFSRRYLAYVLLAILAAMFCYAPFGQYRVGSMVVGVLLAILSEQPIYLALRPASLARHAWARRAVFVGLLALITAFSVPHQDITLHPLNFIALLAGALVFVASFGGNYLWAPGRSKRVMMWFGARSYGLYLAHAPLFALVQYFYLTFTPPFTQMSRMEAAFWVALALGLTFGSSEIVFRYVEWPMRERGKRIAARQQRPA